VAFDYFLKIDGVEGESTDAQHKGEIDITSFSWGESNASNVAHGGGGGTGRVSMQDFHFTMNVNKASPKLMLACATGRHFPSAVLSARRTGGEVQTDFLKWSLADVLVSSYQTAGDQNAGPVDQFSLNFSRINVSYTPPSRTGEVVASDFDVRTNQVP
jgi:type VI secretion system secreted protein Hcp